MLIQSSSNSGSIFRSGDRVPLHCVDRHPNQQHIVATGGQDGMLCVWDVRQGNTPFSLMEAHSAESTTDHLNFKIILYLSFHNDCFIKAFLWFMHSVGSPLPPNQSRSSVHMLGGWFTIALGDFLTFGHALLFARQDNFLCH